MAPQLAPTFPTHTHTLARLVTRNRATLRVAIFPGHIQSSQTLPWTLLSCPLIEHVSLHHLPDDCDTRPIFFAATHHQRHVQHLSMKRDLNNKPGWRPNIRDILGCGWQLRTLELHLYTLTPHNVTTLLCHFPHLRTLDCTVTFCTKQPPLLPSPIHSDQFYRSSTSPSLLLLEPHFRTSSSSSSTSTSSSGVIVDHGDAERSRATMSRHVQLRHLLTWFATSQLESLTLYVVYIPRTREAAAQLKLEDGRSLDATPFVWRSATMQKLTLTLENSTIGAPYSGPCPFALITLHMPQLDVLHTKFVDLRCAVSILSPDSPKMLRTLSIAYSDVHPLPDSTFVLPESTNLLPENTFVLSPDEMGIDLTLQTREKKRENCFTRLIETALGYESAANLQIFTIESYRGRIPALPMKVAARILRRHPQLLTVKLPVDWSCVSTSSAHTRAILRHCPLLKSLVLCDTDFDADLDVEEDVHIAPDTKTMEEEEDIELLVAQQLEVLRLPETSRALWHNLRLPQLRTLPNPTCTDLGAMWRACSTSKQLHSSGALTVTCHPVQCVRRRENEQAFDISAADLGTDVADTHFEWLDPLLSWVPDLQLLYVRCTASDCVTVLETVSKAGLVHLRRVTVEVVDALHETHEEKIIACNPTYHVQLTLERFYATSPLLLNHPRIRIKIP